ncbi:hypothetical protein C0Z18_11175 [Trinickia dabaoshanensis]|uniref:Uncharacterized protein n=1 Tax=Trinickia dabaoshanensis TaxID=564714 RepID=A0A2N7VTK9_9BURK|nr:hypothetical protein C0Z18_11175 [Trinickia dabaoshanensis]
MPMRRDGGDRLCTPIVASARPRPLTCIKSGSCACAGDARQRRGSADLPPRDTQLRFFRERAPLGFAAARRHRVPICARRGARYPYNAGPIRLVRCINGAAGI